jgi:cellulose biosynthesis protein BcsQ
MTSTITVIGARCGQGTTTIASALAVFSARHRPTMLVSADPACAAALMGVPPALDGQPTQITSTRRLDPAGPDPFADSEPEGDPQRAMITDAGRPPQPSCGPLTSLGSLR